MLTMSTVYVRTSMIWYDVNIIKIFSLIFNLHYFKCSCFSIYFREMVDVIIFHKGIS